MVAKVYTTVTLEVFHGNTLECGGSNTAIGERMYRGGRNITGMICDLQGHCTIASVHHEVVSFWMHTMPWNYTIVFRQFVQYVHNIDHTVYRHFTTM